MADFAEAQKGSDGLLDVGREDHHRLDARVVGHGGRKAVLVNSYAISAA